VQAAPSAAGGTLIVVSGRLAGRRVPVGAQPVSVGKGPSTLQIDDDPTVSTRHAEIRVERGQVIVADLGSTNGTFVNNQRVQGVMALTDGDLVRFGNTQIKFRTE
jgi:pSer/pThr/pTyr-binding forkhead associated (FHA) protein